jgi:hypothetical protein
MNNPAPDLQSAMPSKSWSLFVDILVAPAAACDRIAARRRAAIVPYLVFMAAFSVLWAYYYFNVDFPWLIDRMIDSGMSQSGPGVTREAIEARMNAMTPGLMFAIIMFAGIISITMIIVVRAIYLAIVAKLFTKEPPSIVGWIALSIWASVPTLISVLISIIYVMTNDVGTMMPEEISVSSLNRLFMRLPETNPWAAFATSFDMFMLWNSFILGVGFSRWTGRSFITGQAIAIVPFALIYGIWALVIFL